MKEEINATNTSAQWDTEEHEPAQTRETNPCEDCDGDCEVCGTRSDRIETDKEEEVTRKDSVKMQTVDRLIASSETKLKDSKVFTTEQRINVAEFEVREETDGMHFSGYAAMFNSPSQPLPFVERIASGAFKRSITSRNDIKFLWNHDAGEILGSTRAKTMTLSEDDRGLRVDGILPQTSRGRDVAELLRRGDVDSMSFGFSVPDGGDTWSSDGSERTLNSVRLHEVSIVAWPAYTATAGTVSVRKFDKVAARADVNAQALADALVKLEDGLNITSEEQEMLSRVISTLAPEEEVIPEPVVLGDLSMLELKKKKLELLMKGI
tara:strand:- start:156 stop:1121 length:966 start_codon:yes stop_codon:yes gene_type:complete